MSFYRHRLQYRISSFTACPRSSPAPPLTRLLMNPKMLLRGLWLEVRLRRIQRYDFQVEEEYMKEGEMRKLKHYFQPFKMAVHQSKTIIA